MSLEIVLFPTARVAPGPAAVALCALVSFEGRPMCCPRFCARLRPSAVRVRLSCPILGFPSRCWGYPVGFQSHNRPNPRKDVDLPGRTGGPQIYCVMCMIIGLKYSCGTPSPALIM
jgi:hypothetical protein